MCPIVYFPTKEGSVTFLKVLLLLTWSSRQFWGTILLFVCVKFRSKVVVLIYAILYSVLCNFLKHNIFQKNCKMNEQCFVLPINYSIPYPPCKKTAIHSQKNSSPFIWVPSSIIIVWRNIWSWILSLTGWFSAQLGLLI